MQSPEPSPTPKYKIQTQPPIKVLTFSSTLPFSSLPSLAAMIPKLHVFLAHQKPPTKPAGPPFFRYMAIPVGMAAHQMLEMEVGVVVDEGFRLDEDEDGGFDGDEEGKGEGGVTATVELKHLPSGQYLETIHIGEPATLKGATKELLEYAEREGLVFDVEQAGEGKLSERDHVDGEGGQDAHSEQVDRWVGRLEWYESDAEAVSQREWRTRLSFKLR